MQQEIQIKDEVRFLRDRLEQEKGRFHKRRDENRSKAFRLKMAMVSLSALTTVIVGINASLPDKDKWSIALSAFALCTSAAVPILAAWEAFFDHRWLWIQYTATLGELYSLSDELDYELSSGLPISQDKLHKIWTRFQVALQSTNKEWETKRSQDKAQDQEQDQKLSPQSK